MHPADRLLRALRQLVLAQREPLDPRVRAHLADAVRSVLAALEAARR